MKRIAVVLIISSFFLTACATTQWVRTPVAKQKEFKVTLEQLQEKEKVVSQQYAHPCEIKVPVLKKFLQDLSYTEKSGFLGKKKIQPVFQAVEIERLAPVLADALSKADATQRVRFTSHNRGKGMIFTISRETEGVMFVKPEDRLNIAFTYINSEIDPEEVETFPPGFSKMDPLKTRTTFTTLVPNASYAELNRLGNGKTAPMWIVADLDKLDDVISKTPAPPLVIQKKIAPEGQPTVTPATTPAPAKPSDVMLQKDIKNKLEYLKELKDEGLISEDDYNAKKAELLDKIK